MSQTLKFENLIFQSPEVNFVCMPDTNKAIFSLLLIMCQKYRITHYDQMCDAHEANLGIIVENQKLPKLST